MATKNTKSLGNLILGQTQTYWEVAAKQFIWPINIEHKHILVPEKDLHLAEDNLMVMHFRAAGWHIQSAIDVEYTKPFIAPVSDKPIFKPIIKSEEKQAEFQYGNRFKIKSTECELKITSIDKKSIVLEYTNRNKPNIITNQENLSKTVKMGVWIKLL